MKKKTLGLIIAGVAAASMIGTGFAAWIITSNAEQTASGQFNVEQVTEKGVEITATFAQDEGVINFLAPENATEGWLTSDSSLEEKLSTVLTVDFTLTGAGAASDFVVTYDINYSSVQAAITAGYITAPTLTVGDGSLQAFDATDTTVTIAFDWGTAFDGENPYTYYNALENNATNRAAAKTALEALYTAVNNATFTITITAVPATE